MNGGYDDGYSECSCFWGTTPGSLMTLLERYCTSFAGFRVLDAGCGEGKNAAYVAAKDAIVVAVDVSPLAIANAALTFGDIPRIDFRVADIQQETIEDGTYDIVIAYGLFHCLGSTDAVMNTVRNLQRGTKSGGWNIICAFNDRFQQLDAHPGFDPVLLPHTLYCELYRDWTAFHVSDSDLQEVHPHNHILHTHSLTRILAQRR